MKKYIITATCDPYNARFHYHNQRVLKMNMTTPTKWVMDDDYERGYTLEEAMTILDGYANQLSDNVSYIDDEWLQQMVAEAKEYDDIDLDTSWYKGAGWYADENLVYQRGDMSLSYDSMTYCIEEMDDYFSQYNPDRITSAEAIDFVTNYHNNLLAEDPDEVDEEELEEAIKVLQGSTHFNAEALVSYNNSYLKELWGYLYDRKILA